MRCAVLLLLVSLPFASQANPDVWKHLSPNAGLLPQPVHPSQARLVAPAKMGLAKQLSPNSPSADMKDCDLSTPAGLLRGLTFDAVPVARHQDVLLVGEQGPCAWGGTGGGGDMWLIRFEGATPHLLASPQNGFNGWLFSIQQSTSSGFRDVVLGWHSAVDDLNLSYFHFDGKSYVSIDHAHDVMGNIPKGVDPPVTDSQPRPRAY